MLRALVGATVPRAVSGAAVASSSICRTSMGAPIARYGGASLRPVSIPHQRNTLLMLESDRATLTVLPFVARAMSTSSRKKQRNNSGTTAANSGNNNDSSAPSSASSSSPSSSTSLAGSSGSGETGFTADQPITVVPALAVTRPAFPHFGAYITVGPDSPITTYLRSRSIGGGYRGGLMPNSQMYFGLFLKRPKAKAPAAGAATASPSTVVDASSPSSSSPSSSSTPASSTSSTTTSKSKDKEEAEDTDDDSIPNTLADRKDRLAKKDQAAEKKKRAEEDKRMDAEDDAEKDVTYENADEHTARMTARRAHKVIVHGGSAGSGHSMTHFDGREQAYFRSFEHIDQPGSLSDVHQWGTLARLLHLGDTPAGGYQMFLLGDSRIRLNSIADPANAVMMVNIDHMPEGVWPQPDQLEGQTPAEALNLRNTIKAYMLELRQRAEELATMQAQVPTRLVQHANPMFVSPTELHSNPYRLADFALEQCRHADPEDLQAGLASLDMTARLHLAVRLVTTESNVYRLHQEVQQETQRKFQDRQERHVLEEEWKMLGKKLGKLGKNDKEFIGKFQARLKGKIVPVEVTRVIDEEVNRLQSMEPQSMDFGVIRNYLDWLTVLPWGVFTKEQFDLTHAENVLNKDHYGMKDVKDRILEFVSVGKLHGTVPPGKILCFVGPPGVGKTSIGKSIAAALGRKFYRFSVGGMHDVSEVKGHRRTYVGAMPGKLAQALKAVESSNPVILIDEIDKIGASHRGDPSSALLEVLDPEQNGTFMDHYLDVPLDLSKVLFICTANVLDTIPDPLRDRMDFIRLSGYVWQEKYHIAQNYLIPAERKKTGVTDTMAVVAPDAIRSLIRWYCREAGVRNLQKHVEKLLRKVALKIARGTNELITITEKNLFDFVGKPVYTSDRMYERPPAGVVMGLAWSSNGGSTLYIESTVSDYFRRSEGRNPGYIGGIGGGEGLRITGQMGDVMQESSNIAYTVAKHMLHKHDPTSDFFRTRRIHMHVPEGATPKDGPSAGITMVTALMSLALDRPVKANIAMTGEITLTGKVLPIGGLKEKIIAARLAGARELIFPMSNRKDFDELADFIREGLTVHFVDWYQQVFDICFEYPLDDKVVTLVVPSMPEAETIAETARVVDTPAAPVAPVTSSS